MKVLPEQGRAVYDIPMTECNHFRLHTPPPNHDSFFQRQRSVLMHLSLRNLPWRIYLWDLRMKASLLQHLRDFNLIHFFRWKNNLRKTHPSQWASKDSNNTFSVSDVTQVNRRFKCFYSCSIRSTVYRNNAQLTPKTDRSRCASMFRMSET